MSISIITFADLGEKTNLKTVDIEPVIQKFYKEKKIKQIICRINRFYGIKNTFSAVPQFVHYFLKILEKIFPFIPIRNIEEEIFDIRASFLIKPTDLAIFHPAFFPRTIKSAKLKNIITFGIAAVAHPNNTNNLLKDEYKLLNIDDFYIKKENKYTHNTSEIAGSFDYIIAFCDFVKETYIKNGFPLDKIFLAENDININRFYPVSKTDSVFRVLYIAHTNTLKGLHYLLDAWSSLKLKNSELILVGGFSYPMPKELKKRYKKIIKKDSSVKWIGFVKDTVKYYNQANLFVLPSLTESNSRVVMEAMASGLPIITTENAIGLVKDGENGYIVPIRDSVAIMDKIKFLYNNLEISKNMGKKSREIMENKKSFGDQVFNIYNKILEKENLSGI